MTDLLDRLRTAERGTPWMSAEVLTSITGARHIVSVIGEIVRLGEQSERNVRNVTESMDAAWALAYSLGERIEELSDRGDGFRCVISTPMGANYANTPALAICAALVAASL